MATNSAKPYDSVSTMRPTSGLVQSSKPASSELEHRCKEEPSPDVPKDETSPGPAAYSIDPWQLRSVYPSAPRYSMSGRPNYRYDQDHTPSPGPGAYTSDNLDKYKRQAPIWSLGVRHSTKKALFIVADKD